MKLVAPVALLVVSALAGPASAQAPSVPPPGPPAARDDGTGPLPTPDIRPPGTDRAPERVPPRPETAPQPRQEAQPDQRRHRPPVATSEPKQQAQKGLAVQRPPTAAERQRALSDLYAKLAATDSAENAKSISGEIERLWLTSGSDTVNLLMQRAMQAVRAKNNDLALKLMDAAVELAPDYAEAWNRRAYINFLGNDYHAALGDLRRVLALDQNHFKALDGLMSILREIGRHREALAVARQLQDVNPFHTDIDKTVERLAREVEGRGI